MQRIEETHVKELGSAPRVRYASHDAPPFDEMSVSGGLDEEKEVNPIAMHRSRVGHWRLNTSAFMTRTVQEAPPFVVITTDVFVASRGCETPTQYSAVAHSRSVMS
jgi:hypothetical protein